MSDSVDHPEHYSKSYIEAIDLIEAWHLDFHEGNIIKYIARWKYGPKPLEDLKKARWYLDRKIEWMEKNSSP